MYPPPRFHRNRNELVPLSSHKAQSVPHLLRWQPRGPQHGRECSQPSSPRPPLSGRAAWVPLARAGGHTCCCAPDWGGRSAKRHSPAFASHALCFPAGSDFRFPSPCENPQGDRVRARRTLGRRSGFTCSLGQGPTHGHGPLVSRVVAAPSACTRLRRAVPCQLT